MVSVRRAEEQEGNKHFKFRIYNLPLPRLPLTGAEQLPLIAHNLIYLAVLNQ